MARAHALALAAVVGAALVSCAEDEPRFGDPSAIRGKNVPGAGGGGTTPAPGEEDPFFPAGAADPPAPTVSAKDGHATATPAQPPPTPDLGCMLCHETGPAQNKWAYGGYAQKKEGGPAVGATVVVLSGGKRLATKTDADGFFWIPASEGTVAAGATAAVKDAEGNKGVMDSPFGSGNCTSTGCHGSAERGGIILVPE